MVKIGYQASHEQFSPSRLLVYAKLAEQAGFQWINSSDHITPWSSKHGESGFAWSWLGAALAITDTISFSVVNTPGYRYHPAIIAQAAATLMQMFPRRFTLMVGSGEAMNEHITGEKWPEKKERNERLLECVEIIQGLWSGETVSRYGRVVVEDAKVYTLQNYSAPIIGAAITPETAKWVGSWADGMVTVAQPEEQLKKVVEAFKKGGGEGKPMYIKEQISYAATNEKALRGAYQEWKNCLYASSILSELRNPEQFDELGKFTREEDLHHFVSISSDVNEHIRHIERDVQLGFDTIILHNINRDQERFIEDFGEKVLPQFKSS